MFKPPLRTPDGFIVTCADPRCIPENIFNLHTGGKAELPLSHWTITADVAVAEAVVLRVAGGNAQFVLEHILSIDSLVHFTECLVVQHTGT